MSRRLLSANALKSIDAFGKTLEDVKIRTRTGASLTFISITVILFLTIVEFIDYRSVYLDTNIEVNKIRDEHVTTHLNITFPRVPCFLLSLDATDLSGEHMRDISHNIKKIKLDSASVPYPSQDLISEMKNDLFRIEKIGQEGYCGSCFGGLEPEGGCCQTCEQVRKAYSDRGWAFSNPDAIEQCVKEDWVGKVNAQAKDGCRVEGKIRLKKTASSLIFSFGRSFQVNGWHTQELVPYLKDGNFHDFGHYVTSLRFESDDEYMPKKLKAVDRVRARLGVDRNPMDKYYAHFNSHPRRGPDLTQFMFQYFIKVVSTEFFTLDEQQVSSHQYSFSHHTRDVREGYHAKNEDGIETTHNFDARPGVFINIDVSPMQIIHSEKRKPFAHFLTTFCAIVGGVLTVASLVDSTLYHTIGAEDEKIR